MFPTKRNNITSASMNRISDFCELSFSFVVFFRSQIGDGKPMSKKLARKQAAILSGKKSKAFKGGKRKKGRK